MMPSRRPGIRAGYLYTCAARRIEDMPSVGARAYEQPAADRRPRLLREARDQVLAAIFDVRVIVGAENFDELHFGCETIGRVGAGLQMFRPDAGIGRHNV